MDLLETDMDDMTRQIEREEAEYQRAEEKRKRQYEILKSGSSIFMKKVKLPIWIFF